MVRLRREVEKTEEKVTELENSEEEMDVVYEINDKLIEKDNEEKAVKVDEVPASPLETLKNLVNGLTDESFERMSEEFAKKWMNDRETVLLMIDKFAEKRIERMTGEKDLKELFNVFNELA